MSNLALIFLTALGFAPAQAQTVTTPPIVALACAYNSAVPTPTSGNFFYVQCDSTGKVLTSGSGGGAPSGPAGGDLAGTYPNPTLAASITHAITATAFIPTSATVPTLGMYAGTSTQINFATSSLSRWAINSSGDLLTNNTNGPRFANAAASSSAPTIIPNRADTTSGLSSQATGNIDIVVAGAENARFSTGGTILTGTNTNDSASAGKIGEFTNSLVNGGSAIALTTNVPVDVTTLSLTAGDWDVRGQICFSPAATTSITLLQGAINTTTAIPGGGVSGVGLFSMKLAAQVPGTGNQCYAIDTVRVSLASTTTYHLVANATFTVSTNAAFGKISARRVR